MRKLNFTLAFLSLNAPQISYACAVCYGDPQSPMTAGMNNAILVLLGFIGFVLTCVLTVGIYFYKRAKLLNNLGTDK